jgi:hypothetical protein
MSRTSYDPMDASVGTAIIPEHSVLLKDDHPRPIDYYIDYFAGRPPALLSERRPLAIARGHGARPVRASRRMERPA